MGSFGFNIQSHPRRKMHTGGARRHSDIYLPCFSFSRCHFACVANKQGLHQLLGSRNRPSTAGVRSSHYPVLEHKQTRRGLIAFPTIVLIPTFDYSLQKSYHTYIGKRSASASSQTLSIFIQTPSSSATHKSTALTNILKQKHKTVTCKL